MKALCALIMSLALWACDGEDDPSVRYQNVKVPVGRLASDEARERGRELFRKNCVLCHGIRADGNGPRRKGLSRPPANFGSHQWRSNTGPRRVYMVLSEGKRGTSMPAWPTLSDEQKWDVIAYVLSVAEDGP